MAVSDAALSTSPDVTSDANFRGWAQAVHDALIACGLIQTSDTGQLTISTATSPSASAFAGYEVFRFDDAAQATDPIVIKVEYGKGTNANRAALRITIGSSTDGAGTVSNSTQWTVQNGTTPGTTGRVAACHDDDGIFWVWCSLNAESPSTFTSFFVAVERARDVETNALLGSGAIITTAQSGASSAAPIGSGQSRFGGVWATGVSYIGAPPPTNNKIRLSSGFSTQYSMAPMRSFFVGRTGNFSAGDSGTVDVVGTAMTYARLTGSPPYSSSGVEAVLFRYQ